MRRPGIRLRTLVIVVALFAGLFGWGRWQARARLHAPDIVAIDTRPALPGRPILGTRLVRPDGSISLGCYGKVFIGGLTPEEAEARIAAHLRRYVSDEIPRVSVRITRRNSAPGFLERAVRYLRQKAALL